MDDNADESAPPSPTPISNVVLYYNTRFISFISHYNRVMASFNGTTGEFENVTNRPPQKKRTGALLLG